MKTQDDLRRFEQIYVKSLVTVFNECIIANLTEDYFVNCQSDELWTGLPLQGSFATANKKYAEITIHPDELDYFMKYFSSESMLRAFRQGTKQVTKRLRRLVTGDIYHMVEFTATRIDIQEDEGIWCVLVYRDVNDEYLLQQKQEERERAAKVILEDALAKAEEASKAKSEFLSKMSHDMRTPLNAIMGMTQLAQIYKEDTEKLDEYLEKIRISSTHLLGLINEVLDVGKIESGTVKVEKEKVDLEALLNSVVLMVQQDIEGRDQQLEVKISEKLCSTVLGDAQKIRQILVNLVENASKYTKNGGKISLRLEAGDNEESQIENYWFVVEDNGIGMKKEDMERIFNPFDRVEDSRTSEIPGTGLGLTIVRNLILMMGGEIKVESEYEKGSRFTVLLPLEKDREEVIEDFEEDLAMDDFKGMRVLIAEDNLLNREIAVEMFRVLGLEVDAVEDGREAVEAVKNHSEFYYAAVFMDIRMPVMNGYEATECIRRLGKPFIEELPIIAMTADAFSEDIQKAVKAGMNEHLSKPISIERLRKVLRDCVHIQNRNHRKEEFGLS